MQILVVIFIILMIAFALELQKFYQNGEMESSHVSSHTFMITVLGILSIIALVIDFVQGL